MPRGYRQRHQPHARAAKKVTKRETHLQNVKVGLQSTFFHILYIALAMGSRTQIATNQPPILASIMSSIVGRSVIASGKKD